MSSKHFTHSLFIPLRHARFRRLWLANLLSGLGTWMQSFAVSWEIASVSQSALIIALLQVITWAPVLLFSLPAGVIADRCFRPALLFRSNALMACAALAMTLSVIFARHAIFPLLVLTFVMATGTAFTLPAWQASMSGLVEPEEIEAAAVLNNLSYNTAALLGPALGGICFVHVGTAGLFLFNAGSFCALLYLYWRWCHEAAYPPVSTIRSAPPWRDTILLCWRSLRYRRLLGNATCIFYAASALFVFLPLFAAGAPHANVGSYGAMMGSLGAGALLAGFSLPVLRKYVSRHVLLVSALAMFGGMLMVLGSCDSWEWRLPALFCGGMAWATIVSTLNGSAQSAFPDTVRASTLAVFILAVAGGQIVGSASWGLLASHIGLGYASMLAALLMLLCSLHILLTARFLEK